MAQPTQVFTSNVGYEYSVIDNGAAPSFPTLSAGTHIGYDTTVSLFPFEGGANSQGTNFKSNGTIPDAVNRSKAFTCTTAGVVNITKYLNPA